MTTDFSTTQLDQLVNLPDQIINLPDYPCTHRVIGVELRRNHGRLLTLAIAQWHREGFVSWHPVRDIVTQMRLADAVSHLHNLPVNADKLYGPAGRRGPVGREQGDNP